MYILGETASGLVECGTVVHIRFTEPSGTLNLGILAYLGHTAELCDSQMGCCFYLSVFWSAHPGLLVYLLYLM